MSDFLIDQATGDLAYENGDIVQVTGIEEIRQRLLSVLGLVAGEWFFDRNAGVDYYSYVLGKTLDPVAIDAIFVGAITNTPGVLKLAKPIDYSVDRAKRIISLSFEAITEEGTLEVSFTP